jgi:flagellar biogenesis protein FliO
VKREGGLGRGTGNFMPTEAVQISSGALRTRLVALWERVLRISRRTPKYLRLCESLPLGERRFVAVVEFEKERFLVGGTSTTLVLLSRLGDSGTGENDEMATDEGTGGTVAEKCRKNPSGERSGQKRGEKC